MPFLAGRRFKLSRFDGVPSASFTLPAGEDGESVGSGLESLYFAAPLSAVSTEVRGVLVVGVPDSVLPLYCQQGPAGLRWMQTRWIDQNLVCHLCRTRRPQEVADE